MKRIISACLEQTIRFDTYNDADPKLDMKKYFEQLDRKRVKYQIVDQQEDADGAMIVRLKKQYNAYRTDGYIDYADGFRFAFRGLHTERRAQETGAFSCHAESET